MVVIHVLPHRVLTVAPRPVQTGHAAQLRQHGALVRPKLLHSVLLLLGRRLLLLLLWRDDDSRVVLVQMTRVWRTRLHLGGDVVRGGLRLHAWGRTGVWRLGLRSGRRLRGSHLISEGRGQRLALQVGVGRLGHLLGLLRAHGIAVLSRRPPRAQMLLLLEQSLVESLLEQGLRGRRRGSTLCGLGALRRLLWTSYTPPAGPRVTPR